MKKCTSGMLPLMGGFPHVAGKTTHQLKIASALVER
jgi:hypothetical protein